MPERDTVRVRLTPQVAADARREATRAYRLAHGGWAVIGLILMIGGLSFFIDPSAVHDTPLVQSLHGAFDKVWNGAFLLGGLLLMIGVLIPARVVELWGWCLSATTLVTYGVAVFVDLGLRPAGFLALAIAAAAIARIAYLLLYAPVVTGMELGVERRQRSRAFEGDDRRGE
jgi:hypothetical protein